MQVMKDIGGVEVPQTLAKLAGMEGEGKELDLQPPAPPPAGKPGAH